MKATSQIFLSYAREDEEKVENLYQKLSHAGFKPWMDKKDILPGEQWKSSIQKAIQHSEFFLVCLSANSVDKRGWIQREIKQALDIWKEMLESDIYLISVRLEDCGAPENLGDFQWVDLFEKDGWTRLVKAIQVGMERRAEVTKPIVQESTPFEPYPAHETLSPGTEISTPGESPEQVQFSHGYALLIGVGRYKESHLSVPVTAQDAQDLGHILTNPQLCAYPESQVVVLANENANKTRILAELDAIKDKVQGDSNSTIIIFFSGHGWQQDGYYFLPHETETSNIVGTALANEDFLDKVRQIPAQRLAILFNTCFAGGVGTALAPEVEQMPQFAPVPLDLYDQLLEGSGRVIISSSQADEKSWIKGGAKNSLFVAHLLSVLQGQGIKTSENTVRILDVFNYLSEAVPADANTIGVVQTPVLKAYDVTQNFPVALLLGGKRLSLDSDKSDMPSPNLDQMNRKQKAELVRALLACPTMSDRNTRDAVVNDLPDDIKNNIQRNPSDRIDVNNIVTRCLHYPNGVRELIEIVRDYEGASIGMQKVDGVWSRISADEQPLVKAIQEGMKHPGKSLVEIRLRGKLSSFTPEIQFATVGALAGILDIPRDQIRIVKVQDGSIILQIEMPTEAVNRLIALYEADAPTLKDLGVQQVRKVLLKKYRILELLGSGALGDVYLAEDMALKRKVAVKHLKSEYAADKKALERFREEASTIANLRHPNIAIVHGLEQEDGQSYIIMEYAEKGTLVDFLKKERPLPIIQAIHLAILLCHALTAMHRRGIFHRDIKPSNILLIKLEDEIVPKVSDFGLSGASYFGTLQYAPPEQLQGDPVDARSDIYSLGMVLYEMLTGRPPFIGSKDEILRAQLEEEPLPLRSLRKEILPSLEAVVLKALSKKPKDRYETAKEMAKDLEIAYQEELKKDQLQLLYEEANVLFAEKNWQEAAEKFQEVLALDPQYEDAASKAKTADKHAQSKIRYAKGMEYLENREWGRAITTFQKIQRSDPGYGDVDVRLAEAGRQKRWQDLFDEGVKRHGRKDWQRAIEKFTQLLSENPEHPTAVMLLEEAKWRQAHETRKNPIQAWWSSQDSTMKAAWIGAAAVLLAALCGLLGGNTTLEIGKYILGMNRTPTPTVPAPTATSTSTLTSTPAPTATSTSTLTSTPAPTATSTSTLTPTPSPTATATSTSTSTPSPTLTNTPYPTPALVSPSEGTSFPEGQDVKFQWEWERDLAENEFFEVRIRLKGEQEFDQMDPIIKAPYRLVPASELTQAGTYEWQVAIVSLSGEEKGASQIWSFEVR